jgi:solute carrier family 25 (mitochondrial S-adenosylmethionine transporter), member 26
MLLASMTFFIVEPSFIFTNMTTGIFVLQHLITAAVFGDLTGSGWLCKFPHSFAMKVLPYFFCSHSTLCLRKGPSEVIKQKVQAGIYPSTLSAVSSIWKQKGMVGFYEGYFGGVARDVPFRVALLTTYELTKNLYIRIKRRRQQRNFASSRRSKSSKIAVINDATGLSPGEAAFCGAVAGSFSAAITAPLDRIKTLLMTNSAAYGGSVVSCATKIWSEEGIRGLVTGVVPRVIYIAPSVAIFFVAYEMTQQRLQHWQVTSATAPK